MCVCVSGVSPTAVGCGGDGAGCGRSEQPHLHLFLPVRRGTVWRRKRKEGEVEKKDTEGKVGRKKPGSRQMKKGECRKEKKSEKRKEKERDNGEKELRSGREGQEEEKE